MKYYIIAVKKKLMVLEKQKLFRQIILPEPAIYQGGAFQSRVILLLILLLFSEAICVAQAPLSPVDARLYGTQKRLLVLKETYPWLRDSMASIERYTTDFRQYGQIDTIAVALVFHLLPLPDGSNISAADIQAQLNQLNTDFMTPSHPYLDAKYQHPGLAMDENGNILGSGASFQPYLHEADGKERFAEVAGNPQVHFCLPFYAPDGQPSSGVVTVSGTPKTWSASDSLFQTTLGGDDPWPVHRYCNIWIARLSGREAGFAQLPGGPGHSDGIVIDDRYFADASATSDNIFRFGKTLSHLMGNYLNLYELWDDFVPCADDFVEDTPIHNMSNFGLNEYGYRHVSTCDGNPVEMISNLMDNVADTLQYMFTWGQIMRMQAVLSPGGPRGLLQFTPTTCGQQFNEEMPAFSGLSVHANNKITVKTYPNPASGNLTLALETSGLSRYQAHIRVFSIYGALRYQASLLLEDSKTEKNIDVSLWPAGIYTLVVDCEGESHIIKLSVTR